MSANTTYDIIDSRVCVNDLHTITVRMQVTMGTSRKSAIQWVFNNGRFTDFSGDFIQCKKINQLVADLAGDLSLVSEMDEFVSTYTN